MAAATENDLPCGLNPFHIAMFRERQLGILVKIPAGVFVELDGIVAPSGLVTVLWEQNAYAVFYEDLTGVGQVVSRERGLPQAP